MLLKKLIFGFIAGAIAVVTAHEDHRFPSQSGRSFPARAVVDAAFGHDGRAAQIVSDMFWGGLWGVLFA